MPDKNTALVPESVQSFLECFDLSLLVLLVDR
jgi:hypothetical protein